MSRTRHRVAVMPVGGPSEGLPVVVPAPEVVLGHIDRRCAGCGRPWTPHQCTSCGSIELVDTPVDVPAFRFGPLGQLLRWEKPEEEPPQKASPELLATLRGFSAAAEVFTMELAALDTALRSAVRDGLDQVAWHQGLIAEAANPLGDFAPDRAAPLTRDLRSVRYVIDSALKRLEDS